MIKIPEGYDKKPIIIKRDDELYDIKFEGIIFVDENGEEYIAELTFPKRVLTDIEEFNFDYVHPNDEKVLYTITFPEEIE